MKTEMEAPKIHFTRDLKKKGGGLSEQSVNPETIDILKELTSGQKKRLPALGEGVSLFMFLELFSHSAREDQPTPAFSATQTWIEVILEVPAQSSSQMNVRVTLAETT